MIRRWISASLILLTGSLSCRSLRSRNPSAALTRKLCFVGDTGNLSKTQLLIRDYLLKENCDGIHHLGDIIYPRGISSAIDSRFNTLFLDPYKPLLEKAPMSLILGNHDYQGDTEAWLEIAQKNPKIHFPSRYYLQVTKNLCVYSLDTNVFVYGEYVYEALAQSSWLKRSQKRNRCDFNIYLTHHPYQSSAKHAGASGLMKQFLNEQVLGHGDLLISGHDHIISNEGKFRGTTQLISGAGGQTEKGHYPGFITVTLSGSPKKFQAATYELKIVKDNKLQLIESKTLTF